MIQFEWVFEVGFSPTFMGSSTCTSFVLYTYLCSYLRIGVWVCVLVCVFVVSWRGIHGRPRVRKSYMKVSGWPTSFNCPWRRAWPPNVNILFPHCILGRTKLEERTGGIKNHDVKNDRMKNDCMKNYDTKE